MISGWRPRDCGHPQSSSGIFIPWFCRSTLKNLKKAKLLTRSYVKQIEALLEQGDLAEVYQLSVQLFPLSTSFRKNLRGRK